MKYNGLNPFTQSFIYKTFCLSKFTYAIELISINSTTIKKLNIMQNSLIRLVLGLNKYAHMSDICQILNIKNLEKLIYSIK